MGVSPYADPNILESQADDESASFESERTIQASSQSQRSYIGSLIHSAMNTASDIVTRVMNRIPETAWTGFGSVMPFSERNLASGVTSSRGLERTEPPASAVPVSDDAGRSDQDAASSAAREVPGNRS